MSTIATTMMPAVLRRYETRTPGPLEILGHQALPKLLGADTEGAAVVSLVKVPKMSGPPVHIHTREDEWYYILSGEITFQLGDRRVTHGPGASVLVPRGVPHAFQNFADEVAEMLVMFTPAGIEEFFIKVANANLDEAGVIALMGEFGMTPLGPPLGR